MIKKFDYKLLRKSSLKDFLFKSLIILVGYSWSRKISKSSWLVLYCSIWNKNQEIRLFSDSYCRDAYAILILFDLTNKVCYEKKEILLK